MRVLIDTTYAHRAPHSGTAIYVERLCAALADLEGVEVVTAGNTRRRPPAGGGIGSARNLLADELWTQIELPRRARAAGADLIHHPLPAYAYASSLPQAVTVHDLAFEALPDKFDPAFRRVTRHTHRAAARRAGAVICVSETTARDVRDRWGVPRERILVARHGPGQDLGRPPGPPGPQGPPVPPGPQGPPAPEAGGYFLYVGDDEPRKNLPGLIAAYRLYRERSPEPLALVLAGSASVAEPGIKVERSLGAERLASLYAGAVALVHCSWHEGFGMTLLEAMTAGAPVVAARSPGVVEVCGDAARYADPSDPESFADAMAEVAGDRALARELAARGRRQAREFSWTGSARIHLAAYSLAVNDAR